MNRLFKRGLVVGKFAPLHRGHEWLIGRALEACAEVVVLSYANPELPGCDPERRERWLEQVFPQTRRLVITDERLRRWVAPGTGPRQVPLDTADAREHRRFCGFLCRQVLGVTVDAVFTCEDYGDGFAEELTRYFRETDPGATVVRHVWVDGGRRRHPVSGTLVRSDVHGQREWLSPVVYASFVRRVCLLGGESSGKSTLAAALAREFETVHVAEYGRELWETQGGVLVYEDLLRIAEEQVRREEEAMRANRWLFCDTTPLTTLFYSREMFGRAEPTLEALAGRRYDETLLCAPDFPFVQDGTRQSEGFRLKQHEWYLAELARRGIRYRLLTGTFEERIGQVRAVLA
jgi:NadR type nicotinamide-nucleotide adenylyltransferase